MSQTATDESPWSEIIYECGKKSVKNAEPETALCDLTRKKIARKSTYFFRVVFFLKKKLVKRRRLDCENDVKKRELSFRQDFTSLCILLLQCAATGCKAMELQENVHK